MDTKANPVLVKTLANQVRKFYTQLESKNSTYLPYFILVPNDNDITEWYFLIGGLDTPFESGEYLFMLKAPPLFPHSPPTLQFLTTNGVFTPGGPICISIGEFHANDRPGKDGAHGWRASLGMVGFANQVVNALICYNSLDSGIRIHKESDATKAILAKGSRARNIQYYPEWVEKLEEIILQHSQSEPVKNILQARVRATTST
jgi:ubiquitin-protein ligase